MIRSSLRFVARTGWAVGSLRSLLLAILVLLDLPGAVWAHAVATGTEPADGAVLATAPSEVVVRFNEPVALTRAQVLDPTGEDLLVPGSARAGEDGLRISLPAQLDEGSYTVSYHVVSLDGHPIEGSIVFSVGAASSGSSTIEDADWTTVWRRAFVVAHGLLYLGLFGAVGGVAYERLIGSDSLGAEAGRRVRVAAALLGLIAAVAALGLQGGLLLGGPPSLLAQPGTWMEGLGSTFGRTALCAMLGLVLIGAASRYPTTRLAQALAIFGSLVALSSFGLSGHVVTAGALGLTLPALLIHAAMAAFWVGSLVPLLRTLAAPGRAASPEIHRFSGFAVPAVFVLVAAGLLLA